MHDEALIEIEEDGTRVYEIAPSDLDSNPDAERWNYGLGESSFDTLYQ